MESTIQRTLDYENFPQTRYQGSKLKLLDWIWDCINFLDFDYVGDIFGGTAAVSYMFKTKGKSVIYNDIQKYNYYTGLALIENSKVKISEDDLKNVLSDNQNKLNKVQSLYENIYFTDEENEFIDNYMSNLKKFYKSDKYMYASLIWCLFQACIIKRPFNLFHRKNLYMRTSNVKRSFGNKITWDRPFKYYIEKFAEEINHAILNKDMYYKALNLDAFEINSDFDLVYIDTPYIAENGSGVDYRQFYHFLEGLCIYDKWEMEIDFSKKHRPLISQPNPWNSKNEISGAFKNILNKFKKSHIVVSYRSDGIPSIEEIVDCMKIFKKNVFRFSFGEYKYVLSRNGNSQEMLIVGYD